ncbi:MAG: hypothetical protein ABI551_12375 [Polyangiaceae bacterium]
MKRRSWSAALALLIPASALAVPEESGELMPDPTAASASAGAIASPVKSTLQVHAAPIFGPDATTGTGWTEVVTRITNVGGSTQHGTVSLKCAMPWGESQSVTTHAPFSVTPGRTVIVKLPTHGFAYQSPTYTVSVKNDQGALFADITLPTSSSGESPLLVDVDEPSRIAVAMRNWPLVLSWLPAGSAGYAYGRSPSSTLSIGAPSFDPSTGDPVLPDHPAGYAAATVVLIHSDLLARIDATSLQTLADWVIAGGTLAVVPSRPDDLRSAPLSTFIGGNAIPTPPSPGLMSAPTMPRPATPGTLPDPTLDDDSQPPIHFVPSPAGGTNPFVPISMTTAAGPANEFLFARATGASKGPPPSVSAVVSGYSGGNLTPSTYGASAAYGLGEVHLLAVDPTVAPFVDDTWVQSRVVDLVTHAWNRRSTSAIELGGGQLTGGDVEGVRKALDPNENFRGALAIAAILLVLYSIVSGPVIFLQAAKRGNPLAPLKWAPIASLVTFGLIVFIGLAGKGWRGRARHMAFVETGAGVQRGAIRRFRGFFTSDTRKLAVTATNSEAVLGILSSDSNDQSELSVERGGMSIQNVVSLPWQTIVAREDGLTELGGGVAVLPTPSGGVEVVNHTGRELDDILVWVPKDGVRYLPSIADKARVDASTGQLALAAAYRRSSPVSTMNVHPLDIPTTVVALDKKTQARLTEAWSPLESVVGPSVDWLPDDIPVVLAEVKGGEGFKHDSGLDVESDRLFVRVVGLGGTP